MMYEGLILRKQDESILEKMLWIVFFTGVRVEACPGATKRVAEALRWVKCISHQRPFWNGGRGNGSWTVQEKQERH